MTRLNATWTGQKQKQISGKSLILIPDDIYREGQVQDFFVAARVFQVKFSNQILLTRETTK